MPSGTTRCLGQYWCVTCHPSAASLPHLKCPWSCPTRWFLMARRKDWNRYNCQTNIEPARWSHSVSGFGWYTGLIHSAQRKGRSLRPDCNGYPRQGKFVWPHPGFSIQYGSETVCLSGIDRAQHIKPEVKMEKILFVIDDVTHNRSPRPFWDTTTRSKPKQTLYTSQRGRTTSMHAARRILKILYHQ